MAISVRCGACRRAYHLDERFAGRLVQCKQCGAAIQVPSSSGPLGAQAPLQPAYPAEPVHPGLAQFADASGSFPAPLQPARRKASHGPIIFIALAVGTFIGLAAVAVMTVALSLGDAGGGDPGKSGGNGLLSSVAAPKRERNAVRPITAPAEAPVAAVAKPAATTPEPPYAGPSPEPLLQQVLAGARQVNASLAAIRDEATALQHQNEVVTGLRQIAALAKQLDTDFPSMPAAEANRLKAIYEPQMKALGEQAQREGQRIGQIPKAGQILARTLRFEDLRHGLNRPFLTTRARPSAARRSGAKKMMASLTAPASAPTGDPFARYAEREVVEIVIQKLPGNVNEFISDRIRVLSNCSTWTSKGGGDSMRVTIAPISDVRALAARIDFGRVVTIDEGQSMLVVEADAAKLPKPLSPMASNALEPNFYRQNLDDLSSWSAGRRRHAAHRLKGAEPKELRPEISRAFVALMKDPDRDLRSVAIEALPVWASADEGVPVLLEALHDADSWLVTLAIRSLGRFKDLRAVGPLCEQANKYGFQVHDALRAFGESAEPEVLKYLNHPQDAVRKVAIQALGDIGTVRCAPLLQYLLQDRNLSIRVNAKRALEQVQRRRSQQGT